MPDDDSKSSASKRGGGETTGSLRVGPSGKIKRWHFLVDPGLQLNFMLQIFSFSLLIGLAGVWGGIGGMQLLFRLMGDPEAVNDLMRYDLARMAIEVTLAALIVVPLASLFLSHRIAGPAYRLRESCERAAKGVVNFRIRLRKNDQLKSTVEEFNRMLDKLAERQKAERKLRFEVDQYLERAMQTLKAEGKAALPDAMTMLQSARNRIQE